MAHLTQATPDGRTTQFLLGCVSQSRTPSLHPRWLLNPPAEIQLNPAPAPGPHFQETGLVPGCPAARPVPAALGRKDAVDPIIALGVALAAVGAVVIILLIVVLASLRRRPNQDAVPGPLDSALVASGDNLAAESVPLTDAGAAGAQQAELAALRAELTAELAANQAKAAEIRDQQLRLEELVSEAQQADELQIQELARIAQLSPETARIELTGRLEHEVKLAAAAQARKIEAEARARAESRARDLLVTTMQRLAADQTTEATTSTVELPGDDMKGRIIGKEGRNIRSFEQITGVNLVLEDGSAAAVLSCFDPLRREIARLTLVDLVADGRIHPPRIEEAYHRSERRIKELGIRAGEDALVEMGITDLDPELLPYLGTLRYRTSYGQNVLAHLVEAGHIAGLLAAELGLDVEVCKRAAFLHDIGKAVTQESEGSHAAVGAELARRHGESPDVVHAIEAHHNEVEPMTVEAVLTQIADAISGGRPGARRESMELYLKRLERIEQLAAAHFGVEKVFAMQAGHEVRVMVAPQALSDAETQVLARDIAAEIEAELSYPGIIRVTVIRESRATALAR